MSGGHFEYQQYRIRDIADTIERDINGRELDEDDIQEIKRDYESGWQDKDFYEYCKKHMRTPPDDYQPCTFSEFKHGYVLLRLSEIYAQRIDWLQSGDDGEENFHERLAEDIAELKEELKDKDTCMILDKIMYSIKEK